MLPNIEIIVGTYEEFLLGYKFEYKDDKAALSQSFADRSHSGALKCLAVQGRWIATGATDDRIFVYDMRTRKQTEILLSHDGTINALTFTTDGTHLFSGGDDGRMVATQVSNWLASATWKKAHDGNAITHISCHPSGKLALSLGSDLVLRTWNLVKGRVAYKHNLKSRLSLGRVADCLAWSPTGDYFALCGQRVVELWSIQKADVVRSQKTSAKPISLCWVNDETCIVGLEDGKLQWVTLKEDEKEVVEEAHSARVKSMTVWEKILVTVSSSGEIKVWEIDASVKKLKEIATTNIGCRPTCVGILDLKQFGSDYKLKVESLEPPVSINKSVKRTEAPRGIVTIEYENDDDQEVNESAKNIKQKDDDDDDDSEDENEVDEEEEKELGEEISEEEEEEEEVKPKKRRTQPQSIKSKNLKQSKLNKSNKRFDSSKGNNLKRKNK